VALERFAQGRDDRLWLTLGARAEPDGTGFAVWAPRARGVLVDGDFTGWRPAAGVRLRRAGTGGVWCGFAAGAVPGQRYRYRILGADRVWRRKADPMARQGEAPPGTASVIESSGYAWGDADWLARRAGAVPRQEPMSVYEVHLGSWRPGLSYLDLADQLVRYVHDLGFTHVEFLPVMAHPYGGSWGYQVTGYFCPTARLGAPDHLRYLVDRLHQAGIGVILDWVPAHFPRDDWALARFDGAPLYEDPDPYRGEHPDWGTLVFDYARPQVRNFLRASALYWAQEFHADGLRVDAVSSMLYLDYSRGPGRWRPNVHGGREHLAAVTFLTELTTTLRRTAPGLLLIAEESATWPGVSRPVTSGGLGFGLKWSLGWMHDTLAYLRADPLFRRHHHDRLTAPLRYGFAERYLLPLSHDEVVHGKGSLLGRMPGDPALRLAGLRALLAYQWAFPGKKLLFMGAELAQEAEWSESRGLDWPAPDAPGPAGVARLLADLNREYRARPALWARDGDPAALVVLASDADANLLAFARYAGTGPPVVAVANFAGTAHHGYRLGLPVPGVWREVVNTDAGVYHGSGVGNLGVVRADGPPLGGQRASAAVSVGPCSVLWLTPAGAAGTLAAHPPRASG